MKVAYFSPLPPERTGIADYSALLLPALEQRMEVEVVRRGAKGPPRDADVSLFHVGNNPDAHEWIVDALARHPGVVVLHDFVLHHLVAGLTLGRGKREQYLDAVHRDAGVVGRLLAHGVIDGLLPPLHENRPQDFPLVMSVISESPGVICHSRYVERGVVDRGYAGRVWRIRHPAWEPAVVEPMEHGRGGPVVCSFGNLNRSKRLDTLLWAFSRVRKTHPDALLVLAGPVAQGMEVARDVSGAGLRAGEDVILPGYLDEQDLWRLLAASDVVVNLRRPTMGETSGSALRALSAARPLVVSDVGWFSELPDEVAMKVPVDETEERALAAALELLLGDEALRGQMSSAAREYVRREHDLDEVADRYRAALEEAAGGPAVRDAVLGEVGQAAHDVGIGPHDPQLGEVGRRAREVGIGP